MNEFASLEDELPPPISLKMTRNNVQELDNSLLDDELPTPPPLTSLRPLTIIIPQDKLPNLNPYIIINSIKFTLIEKLNIDNIVVISSEINNHTIQFKVYPSTSELEPLLT